MPPKPKHSKINKPTPGEQVIQDPPLNIQHTLVHKKGETQDGHSTPMTNAEFKKWSNDHLGSTERRKFDLHILDIYHEDPGSPTDPLWRSKICNALVTKLDPNGLG